MIPTIFSSFLFLLPIYMAHIHNDTIGLFIFTIAMGISIANHSHTYHKNKFRRILFLNIDCYYMLIMTLYILYNSLYKFDLYIIIIIALLNYYIYCQLCDNKPEHSKYKLNKYLIKPSIEYYTKSQEIIHILFHITGIISLTFARYCNY